MASNPTYKPSLFAGRKDLKKLAPLLEPERSRRADNYPAFNRAIQVGYPPGSTFKPVTALAAMQEHLLTPFTPLHCTPTLHARTGRRSTTGRRDIDQWMDLRTALAESCDTFFYQLGDDFYRLPPNRGHPLQGWANRFGFGKYTGIDIGGETKGLIPTPEWRCEHYGGPPCQGYVDRIWKPGYSIQLAIGQGDVLVTPLQMARFYALIANGGKLVTPHLAEDVEQSGSDGQPLRVLRRFGAQPPQPVERRPDCAAVRPARPRGGDARVDRNVVRRVRQLQGRHRRQDGLGRAVRAREGLPNALKLNQSWWCGYGPFDAPTIVVCAVIENGGHGGSAAAPAALKVFEKYFHTTATTTPKRERLMGIEVVDARARGLRPRREVQSVGRRGVVRRLDWLLMGALVAVTAFGLWAIDGITRHDAGGSSLSHQVLFAVAGAIVFAVALFVDPELLPAAVAADLLRDARDHGARARRRRGDARLEALDRRRLLQVPAVRVREGAASSSRSRASSPSGGTRCSRRGRRSRRSGSALSRSCSCSSSRTSAPRSCTPRRSRRCCSSPASAGRISRSSPRSRRASRSPCSGCCRRPA